VIDRSPHDLGQLVREVLEFVEPEDAAPGSATTPSSLRASRSSCSTRSRSARRS
jgi:hypothetical protein